MLLCLGRNSRHDLSTWVGGGAVSTCALPAPSPLDCMVAGLWKVWPLFSHLWSFVSFSGPRPMGVWVTQEHVTASSSSSSSDPEALERLSPPRRIIKLAWVHARISRMTVNSGNIDSIILIKFYRLKMSLAAYCICAYACDESGWSMGSRLSGNRFVCLIFIFVFTLPSEKQTWSHSMCEVQYRTQMRVR